MTNLKKQAELDRIREEREAWENYCVLAKVNKDDPDSAFPQLTLAEFSKNLVGLPPAKRRELLDTLLDPAIRQASRMLTGKAGFVISREEPMLLYVGVDDEIDMEPRPGGLKPDDNIQN